MSSRRRAGQQETIAEVNEEIHHQDDQGNQIGSNNTSQDGRADSSAVNSKVDGLTKEISVLKELVINLMKPMPRGSVDLQESRELSSLRMASSTQTIDISTRNSGPTLK